MREKTQLDWPEIGAILLLVFVSAQGQSVVPIANVLPTAKSLGIGWQSRIEILLDPDSRSAEVFSDGQYSDSDLKAWRHLIQDTNYTLSGWAHLRFEFSAPSSTNRYYLQVDRFRSKTALTNRFANLLASHPTNSRSAPPRIGEVALVEHEEGAVALWFRRREFLVHVASFGQTPSGTAVGSMQHLAKAVDRLIKGETEGSEGRAAAER